MDATSLTLLVLVVAAVAAWWFFQGSPAARERADLERFVGRLRGDREMAERLIAHELGRDPSLTRHRALLDAMQRLSRDRR
ncbi:MAG: hypothetical protein JWM10_557 [Myxococcaceae bacterium]|nr:hypothetical protein [Myxococcaceae bacterium]